jgi:hypothetical protein
MGDATNMIFMAVGHDHSTDSLLVLTQIAGVGQNDIDAVHAIAWEGQSSIDKHDLIAILEHTGVLADFVEASQGDHTQGLLLVGGSFWSVLAGHSGEFW